MSSIEDAVNTLDDLEKELRQAEEKRTTRAIETFEAAKNYIEAKRISDAVCVLLEGIQPIDPREQFNWGVCYYNGLEGVAQNFEAAFYWFKKASDNGDTDAKEAIEVMMSNKKQLEQNEQAEG